MKNLIYILSILLISANVAFAQTFTSDSTNEALQSFNQRNSANLVVAQQNSRNQQTSNIVFIDQVGDFNQAQINVRAAISDINLFQQGDDNDIFLNVTANQVRETVVQLGDNHNFTDFSQNTRVHNLELLQQGNNQNLIWYGGNSISDDLKIKMQGNAGQSVIVRNFN